MTYFAPASKILQVRSTPFSFYGSTAMGLVLDDTIPQRGEATDIASVSFTPKAANSKLLLQGFVNAYLAVQGTMAALLFQDGIANALRSAPSSAGAGFFEQMAVSALLDAGSLAPRTYVLAVAGNQIVHINGTDAGRRLGGASVCELIVTEIAAE